MPPMGYDLTGRLVVGVASSALFDLTDSDRVFRTEGEAAYRAFQEKHLDDPLRPGTAFGFVRRLLGLNDLAPSEDDPLVEVIVMSRNSPETGLRVMRSIRHHELPITRAVFRQGHTPYEFIRPLHMDLFLSADEASVREAVARDLPAGYVLDPTFADEPGDELRIAFDFDGVLADDSSEQRFRDGDLADYRRHEEELAGVPLGGGPLRSLLVGIHRVQEVEQKRRRSDPSYVPRVHVALVTARSAPAHERAVATLKSWGVTVDDAFFLGGIDKAGVLEVLRPHIFFDDQRAQVESARQAAPSVHVPYGALNRTVAAPSPSPSPAAPPASDRPAGRARDDAAGDGPAAAPSAAPPAAPAPLAVPGVARISTVVPPPAAPRPEVPPSDGDEPRPAAQAPVQTGTKELPVVTRVPELTVLGGSRDDDAPAHDEEAASSSGEGLPAPKPLPVRQSSGLARHR